MELPMRSLVSKALISRAPICCTALGLALAAGTAVANAQTVMAREITEQPVETVITQQPGDIVVAQQPLAAVPVPAATVATQPVQTVRTVETIRTVRRPAHVVRRIDHHRVVTTRTIVRERVVPVPTVVAPAAAAAYPAPDYGYDVVQAPVTTARRPLYDAVVPPAPIPAPPAAALPVADQTVVTPAIPGVTTYPSYRYIYEPDRILVVDPTTGVAVQAIPR
jgi:hypothetical protein